MAKETNTVTFETLEQNLGVAVNLLLSFVVFVLTLLSTPISQFKGKGIHEGGASKISCVTVWGLKYFCSENPYEYRPADIGCDKVASLFKAAEAFYVLSVICAGVCCATSFLYFFQGWKSRVLVIIPAALQVVLTLIPWACMTAVWYQDYCGGSKVTVSSDFGLADGIPYGTALRDNFKTSAGYGLTIAAWCIQVISVGVVTLL